MSRSNSFISKVIYQLKRQYGQSIDLYVQVSAVADPSTGRNTEVETVWSIRKAAVLPSDVVRQFAYDLSFIAANKNFTYGGVFTEASKALLVDNRDLPIGYKCNLVDRFVINHRRYQIEHFAEYEEKRSTVFFVKELANQEVNEISSGKDWLTFSEEATAVVIH